ncbi:MAG: ABC transporter substrate-binding protein [Mariprofundaceae bacterium]|nr:ABC transporter substrate-binding protein [Mariprofundaceae bacterium]
MRRLFFILCLTWCLPLAAWAESGADAEQAVRHVVDELTQVLKAREDSEVISEKDMDAIHAITGTYFDFRKMAKSSLAKNWKKLKPAQQDQFVATFRMLLERSYGGRLSGFQDQTVSYLGSKAEGDAMVVSTEVKGDDLSIPIQYKLHQKDHWLIYDIRVEGQSLGSTYRSDFKKVIKKKGFDGLMTVLQSKLDALKAN